MPTLDRFTRHEVSRILGVTPKQLAYWERLGLTRPQARWKEKYYGFTDLISARAVKQLTDQHVPARRVRQALKAIRRQLTEIQTPLTELRILSNGRQVVVEHKGTRVEPLSGQLVLNFDTRELGEKIRGMPERSAEDWFALALDLEANPGSSDQATEAYRQALARRPDWTEACLNLGALLFERGETPEAAKYFRRAAELAPENALAHYNLASALYELGEPARAYEHLHQAVRLRPHYADAVYNLALAAENLGFHAEARQYWQKYLQLDSSSTWASHARHRLARKTGESSE